MLMSFLGSCVMTLEYLGLAILLVEFSIWTKCSAKLAAKDWNANRLKGSFALDAKRECEENRLDVESKAEEKSKTKQRESSENIYSSEPVVCRAQFTSHGSKRGDGGYRIPRFSSAQRCLSLIFHLENSVSSPCPFLSRALQIKGV